MLIDIIKKYDGIETSALKVYEDIFHVGDGLIQKKNEEPGHYKSNPIAYWKNHNESKGHYRILFEDDMQNVLQELQRADFSIVNGITYFGRKNIQAHASKMYAMIFDLDGVTEETLENFFFSCQSEYKIYPLPNYVILSGHGVHLYYLFDEPISLYPNIKMQLKNFKYGFTQKIWNRYTTTLYEKIQYQGINQGFRVIGGKTKIDNALVRAFEFNKHPWTIEQLNEYVIEEYRVDTTKLYKESMLSLNQAKEKYPEWYQKRVVQQLDKGAWKCKPDLYNWWIRKIEVGAVVGHRYFCIMCLAIYGIKSGIDLKQVRADAERLLPVFNALSIEEPFTKADIESALDCFDERYIRFPIDDISKISGISIEKNKRNGRKQSIHLERARAVQKIDYPGCEWRNVNGRPQKEELITQYIQEHPEESATQIARALKCSRTTVYKYMK